ncbi:toxin ETX/toxin MTX2 [Thermoactinomyces sp. DSM 45891]|uniref:ETX/MTX2 family pore-forming toxin n=1 Tax=Thermoactinomyces sp. DSM 45891 TaxID=1761907 RepID=UPI0009106EDF|nr:ETX/MTX2 family pore-forming toxin [Thermoactinomyces sp. DSM 45891]SFX31693.1 toxin ETX/toxin MTX2 [Thermoactinomyces sp. DSM 45891]
MKKMMRIYTLVMFAALLAFSIPANTFAETRVNTADILDLKKEVQTALNYTYRGIYQVKSIDKVTANNPHVRQSGSPVINDVGVAYVGVTRIENNLDIPQTISTQAFSEKISDTVSNSVTRGLKIGAEITAGFSFLGGKLSTEFSFSSTQGNNTTVERTISVPSQQIVVPARTRIQITANLHKKEISGKTALRTGLGGKVRVKDLLNSIEYEMNLYDIVQESRKKGNTRSPLIPNPSNSTVSFSGAGTYSGTYGTDLELKLDYFDLGSTNGNSRFARGVVPQPYKSETIIFNVE